MQRKAAASILVLLFFHLFTRAQFIETFDDGDFTANPRWSGDTNDFTVNASHQLQSNSLVPSSNYYLSTPNTLAQAVEWNFFLRLDFNPSSANYVDVYLIASLEDLMASGNTGYFLRIGNTDDELALYRKDDGNSGAKIIDGTDGVLNQSSNLLKIRITRNVDNLWTLYRDVSGTGNSFVSEGSVTDATYTSSAYFGVLIKQSTASFFQKHFIDDIEIKDFVPDLLPPAIQTVSVLNAAMLDVLFSEVVDKMSGEDISNYVVDQNIGRPAKALQDVLNPSLIHLEFTSNFTNANTYMLTVNGVKDNSGNTLTNQAVTFNYFTPQLYDIVIDEIMADPSPQVGLPNSEWIELRNRSSHAINLGGWRLGDMSNVSSAFGDFLLQPDSSVLVSATAAAPDLRMFGTVISVGNFPSLDNSGDIIFIKSGEDRTIHAVAYSDNWYGNALKKGGGWTLEMIDVNNPCSGITNWKASVDSRGGTPGKINSVNAVNADVTSPHLLRAFAADNRTINLVFDEPLDSFNAVQKGNYNIGNGVAIMRVAAPPPLFNTIVIYLNTVIDTGKIYTVTTAGITDCSGNVVRDVNQAKFGLAQSSDSFDVVINEVLFNPKPAGADYVELYNRSEKIVDLSQIYVATRNRSNAITTIEKLTAEQLLFFPGDFIVITENVPAVKSEYITLNPGAFLQVQTMPSLPDDKGTVIILNSQGEILDEVNYSEKWHSPLVTNAEGASLERIDYEGASVQSNFHTAAASAGYGTPGFRNSQYRLNDQLQGEITISPEIFSPDNDGLEDFLTINYKLPSPGFVANITIFDATGRPVRYLRRNALSGVSGYYRWDGLDDKNRQLPQGIYIIYTEVFNTAGKKKQFKNTVVLARKY
ncbi:MAG: lamin tail domain-containing protein [Ginsengibacter sp.]